MKKRPAELSKSHRLWPFRPTEGGCPGPTRTRLGADSAVATVTVTVTNAVFDEPSSSCLVHVSRAHWKWLNASTQGGPAAVLGGCHGRGPVTVTP